MPRARTSRPRAPAKPRGKRAAPGARAAPPRAPSSRTPARENAAAPTRSAPAPARSNKAAVPRKPAPAPARSNKAAASRKPTSREQPAPRKRVPRSGGSNQAAVPRKPDARQQPAPRKPGARNRPVTRPAPRTSLRGGSAVVKVLDARQPIEALRKFLARIPGEATREQGQIALGSAQLMLLPIAHEHRGGAEVKQLLDLVLARWDAFPDRTGFHAQEFLRNAFAAVGDDRDRIARLAALVPTDATSELRFNLAAAHAIAGDRPAMLLALETALASGATAAQVRRAPDFAPFLDDPAVIALLDRTAVRTTVRTAARTTARAAVHAALPEIPVDVDRHVAPIRAALDSLIGTLRKLGEPGKLNPPATLDAVLAAERARRIQLPNDYRALLTITDGMALWDHEFFGTLDYRGDTALAARARAFLEMSAGHGGIAMDDCVPLASWGQPNNWLLYDPRGAIREGDPGYVVMLTAAPRPMNDLADALLTIEDSVRDVLSTN